MEKDINTAICTTLDDFWQTTTNSLKLSVSTMKLMMKTSDSELLNNAIEAINKVLAFGDDHQGALKFKSSAENDTTSNDKAVVSSRSKNEDRVEDFHRVRKVLADITNDAPLPIWKTFSTTTRRHRDKENIPIPQHEVKERLKKVTQMYSHEDNQRISNGQVQHRNNASLSPSSSSSTTNEFPINSLSSSGTISCSCSIFDIADIIKTPNVCTKFDNITENTTTTSSSSDNIKASTSFTDTDDNITSSTSSTDIGNIKSTEPNTTKGAKSRFTEISTDNIISDTSGSGNSKLISDNTKTEVFAGDIGSDNNETGGDDEILGINIDEKYK